MRFKNVITKVVLIVIACSLAFTAFGSLFPLSKKSDRKCVARVKGECIPLSDYQDTYHREVSYAEKVIGHRLSEGELERFGVKDAVLKRMVNDKTLEVFAHDLGLLVSQESVKEYIRNLWSEKGKHGKFDEDAYRSALSEAGITEAEYIGRMQKLFPMFIVVECLLRSPASAYMPYNSNMVQELFKNINQSRVVDVIEISPDAVKNVPAPADSDLEDLYKTGIAAQDLRFPEYRTVKYVAAGSEDFLDQVSASAEEVNSEIKNSELDKQRDIFNLVFLSEEEARAAQKSLEGGESFESLVQKASSTLEKIKMKNITKSSLPSDLRGAVFDLAEGEVSKVLHSVFGWHLIKVASIHEISVEDLAELRNKISLHIRQQKATELLSSTIKKVNEKISHGVDFDDAISSGKFRTGTMEKFDIEGRDHTGKFVELPEILRHGDFAVVSFSSQINKPSHFVGSGEAYFSVNVTEVIPAREKSFEESRSILSERWRKAFVMGEMHKLVTDLTAKVKAGEEIAGDGVYLDKGQVLQRVGSSGRFSMRYPVALVDEVFSLGVEDFTKGFMDDKKEKLLVALLKDIRTPAKVDEQGLKALAVKLGNDGVEAVVDQLFEHLGKKYSIKVNKELISAVN